MASTSQFTIYTSSDPQGPGSMMGFTGSLTSILDACLVYGYGTGSYYKAPIGWTKPLPNISASVGSLPQLTCYKAPSGSAFTLFVNDASPNQTIGAREAWACGFEYITSLTGSVGSGSLIYTGSYGNGTGYGQFPLPSQLLTGHVVWAKSLTATNSPRFWFIAADAYTVYIWVAYGDGYYYHGGFGDFFSLRGSSDVWRGFIYGRALENTTGGPNSDWTDMISSGAGFNGTVLYATFLGTAQPGHFLARSMNGTAGSIPFGKKGDPSGPAGYNGINPGAVAMAGVLQTPNGTDNSIYIQPLQIIEPTNISLRGRLRGLYHLCHPISNFSDGQIITAGGDYGGKTLMVVKIGSSQTGAWLLEISPTVETN